MMNWRKYPSSILSLSLVLAFCFCTPIQLLAQEDDPGEDQMVSENQVSTAAAPEGLLFSGRVPSTIEELRFMESHVSKLAEKVFPSTVNIQMGASQGSGVVVSSDGYILTAAHVIGSVPNRLALITFMVDGKEKRVYADTLGVQAGSVDCGLLKIREGTERFNRTKVASEIPADDDDPEAKIPVARRGAIPIDDRFEGELPFVDLGVSQELKLGQWVVAVGHPGGIDPLRGLVVRVGRIIDNRQTSLRTDCTLVGGDSGGPLFDMSGQVVGIHSRIGQTLADNLHVPADIYSEKWDMLSSGVVINGRGTLGFSVAEETNVIEKVVKKGPADEAGMKKGDVVIKLASIKISSKKDIKDAFTKAEIWPNKVVRVVVQRGEEEMKLKVKVGIR